jgi:hypothetical protein
VPETVGGVDTWSVCWYLREGSSAEKAISHLATEPGPRSKLIPEKVAGHRVGWFPGTRMLFAEGHPSQEGLCSAYGLSEALQEVSAALCDRGIIPPLYRRVPEAGFNLLGGVPIPAKAGGLQGTGFGGIRRLDSTVDLHLDSGAEGLAVLAGVAAVPVPRSKTQVVREVGGRRVETVYFRGSSGKRVLGRWYDKGVESGRSARGLHVRPEDQRRYPKAARLSVEAVAGSSYVRDSFVRRFEPLWRASKGVMVAKATDLAVRINELVEEGELTPAEGVRVAGFLLLEQANCNPQGRRTRYRTRRLCADNGLVLADGVTEEVEVELAAVIEKALDGGVWGGQG